MGPKYTLEEDIAWHNALPTKRLSAAVILRAGDAVLMIKDDYKPFMTFPGGVVDASESPFAAALRETYEEVGIKIAPEHAAFFSVSYVPERHGFFDRLHFFFTARVEQSVAIQLGKNIQYFRWVPIADISELSGKRPGYAKLQEVLQSDRHQYYFEAPTY